MQSSRNYRASILVLMTIFANLSIIRNWWLACKLLYVVSSTMRRWAIVVYSFFFASRRRHTRLQGDWSSDVCSSDLVRSDARASRHRIDAQAAKAQLGAFYRLAAADKRPDPRLQFRKRERFGDVVIGSEVEAAHAVRLGIVGGKDQNAAGLVVAAQLSQDLESVDARKTDIEHDEVIVLFRARPQCEFARFRVIDGVPRLSQRSHQPVRQCIVVFDDQNSHDKWLSRFEVQDSTRTGSGFSNWAHGIPEKKVRGGAARPHATEEERDYGWNSTRSGLQ